MVGPGPGGGPAAADPGPDRNNCNVNASMAMVALRAVGAESARSGIQTQLSLTDASCGGAGGHAATSPIFGVTLWLQAPHEP